jgi:hypothetical protein
MLKIYEEEKEKALVLVGNLLDEYEFERAKRSSFQYEMTLELKKSKAEMSLKRAKNFLNIFRTIMHKI